jgi:hypothetical protein
MQQLLLYAIDPLLPNFLHQAIPVTEALKMVTFVLHMLRDRADICPAVQMRSKNVRKCIQLYVPLLSTDSYETMRMSPAVVHDIN